MAPELDSPFTIRVVDDVEGMGALEDAWNALAPPDCKPMRQYAWMRSIAESFCAPGELRVYVCERAGRVEAIAPLVQRQAPPRLAPRRTVRDCPCTGSSSHAVSSTRTCYAMTIG